MATAAISANQVPALTTPPAEPMPGRRITSTPTKPIAVAVQRRQPTVSRRNSAAPMIANSGVRKLMAVTSPTGSRASAMKNVVMPTRPMTIRTA